MIESIDRIYEEAEEADTDSETVFDCPDCFTVIKADCVLYGSRLCPACWEYEGGKITLEELKEWKEDGDG